MYSSNIAAWVVSTLTVAIKTTKPSQKARY